MNATTRDESLASVEISVQVVILCLTVAGNTFVLVALLRHRRPLSRIYFLMVHLSLADLMVAAFSVLPQLLWDVTYRFRGPDVLCRVVKYLQVFVLYLSTYILVAMAVDRYLTVRSVHVAGLRRTVRAMVAGSWVLSALLALPQAFVFRMRTVAPGVEDCWAEFIQPWGVKAYVSWFVISIFALPIVVIAICYGMMYRTVQRISRTSRRVLSRSKSKTLRLTLCVVVCFFVCWSPFCFTQLAMAFSPPESGSTGSSPVHTVLLLLASLNSCTNPWIYLAFSSSLVNQLRLCCGMGLARTRDNDSVGDDDNPDKGACRAATTPVHTKSRSVCDHIF